ncbi:hypothetical protein AYO47_06355 [Planctomyces sp. SCGC AG-212-M04]|nr:hypothetical protein AYO47_06355 [Planctomyces sp. SCGC AG-212-M04]
MLHVRHWLFVASLLAAGCSQGVKDKPGSTTDASSSPATAAVPDPAPESPVTVQSAAPAPAAEEAPKKPSRAPIYAEEANGESLIAAALDKARLEHKRVLIEWGGNWCGWCYKLHDVFHKDPLVQPIVHEEYELVLIDCTKNRTLMQSYGGKDTQYGYPYLTILDEEGKTLTNQETGSLEDGPKHVPERVADFLKKWSVERPNAEELIAAAIKSAKDSDRAVIVQVGDPYCGWCKVLSRFFARQQSLLEKDYVRAKIDTQRMDHADDVVKRFLPEGSLGHPWMVILNREGEVVATSVGPDGNIGCPSKPEEIDHFIQMLASTKKRLGDADLDTIRQDLNNAREEREKKAAERAKASEQSQ